jgi:hypothetical protein
LNTSTDAAIHKITEEFHSIHFYIINNKCLPRLFAKLGNVYEQIDVLFSDLRHEFNFYNIHYSVHQRSISTNTQNNLYTIFKSENYIFLSSQIKQIRENIKYLIDYIIPGNKYNEQLSYNILFDIVIYYIVHFNSAPLTSNIYKFYNPDSYIYTSLTEYKNIVKSLTYVLQCTKKGINVMNESINLINNIIFTICYFSSHNSLDPIYKKNIKAYSYGSSGTIYIIKSANIIIKKYHDFLRYENTAGLDITDIYNREIYNLRKLGLLIHRDDETRTIYMPFMGVSLYDDFNLPDDYVDQLTLIFKYLDEMNIYYPEFRLHNILNNNNKLTFIDFGGVYKNNNDNLDLLCESFSNINITSKSLNENNLKDFIFMLTLLKNRFHNETKFRQYIIYETFINNIKLKDKYKYLRYHIDVLDVS